MDSDIVIEKSATATTAHAQILTQIQSIPGRGGDLAFNWRRIGLGSRLKKPLSQKSGYAPGPTGIISNLVTG